MEKSLATFHSLADTLGYLEQVFMIGTMYMKKGKSGLINSPYPENPNEGMQLKEIKK